MGLGCTADADPARRRGRGHRGVRRHAVRVADPLVDVGLLRRRPFLADVAVNGLVQFGLLAAVLHSSLYLQDLLHFSPLSTGLAVLAMVLPITVAAQLGGRWFDRSGVRPPVLAGLTISTLGMLAGPWRCRTCRTRCRCRGWC